jgi:hypothetical protein
MAEAIGTAHRSRSSAERFGCRATTPHIRAVREIEDGGPSDVGLRAQASKHPVLRWLKTVVVSDREKAHEMRQVGTRKTYQKHLAVCSGWVSLLKRRKYLGDTGSVRFAIRADRPIR